ncbi:MAG: hypothetical protein JRI68_26570 [Deltaproteobacteria bacterium]|nr:hypothetical protein [Deltaproteobacteria bacterium]
MVLPLLLLAWGCDGPSRDDCPPPASVTTGATARQSAPPKRPFKLPGVMKIDDGTYGLKTDSIVALLTHAFECGARATPLPGAGYRLEVVPPGSPLEQLGLKSGDEVRAIAEITLTSPKSLYRAFRAARDRPLFHLQGRRGGAPLRINYLLADDRPSCPPCAQADAEPPPPLDEKTKQAIRRGIQQQPDGSYRVRPKVLDSILDHQAQLMREARIVPVLEADQVVGIRLAGVSPDSLLARLGLQNDDVLISINGFALTVPDKALEAYAQVRAAKQIDLSIKRNGKLETLTYRVAK